MKNRLTAMLTEALRRCMQEGLLPEVDLPSIELETTKDSAHGDYATNIAMLLGRRLRKNPHEIATMLIAHLDDAAGLVAKVEVAGPGFLNFFLRESIWREALLDVEAQGEHYGARRSGAGKKVQVEFVSANPTGPLHIGHARGAVVGDVIASLLAATGCEVWREYYINDAGNQMQNLGKSVYYRYRQLFGEQIDFPETCYQGDYIRELARQRKDEEGDLYLRLPADEAIRRLTAATGSAILEEIKEDLAAFGVVFGTYFSESELYRDNRVMQLLAELEAQGYIYCEDGTRWFRATLFGDEKDRVVVRKNGEPTYFAADLAYHESKYRRGFEELIDIWGADHHGYIPRMKAGIQAMGRNPDSLRVVLVQLVNLLRDGKPVTMSTRAGEFVTLHDVVAEVGRDAARYNFLMRRSDSHLDFDLELAKRQSNENPVYYVQYAHARICSILRLAGERDLSVPAGTDAALARLELPGEMALVKAIVRFPELLSLIHI